MWIAVGQLRFVVPTEYEGATLKGFLRSGCGISARLLAKLKRIPMGLTVNHEEVFATALLHAGDKVRLSLPESENALPPSAVSVPVVWEDEYLLVFNKPPHMAVHPSPGNGENTLANAASAYAEQKGECWAFRPINRLDKDTSGLVLAAKDSFTAAQLAHQVRKEYLAVCEGELFGEGTIDAPIRLMEGHSIQRETGEGGLPAVTHWNALATGQRYTLLKLWLETGRTHQIRVHMAYLGHPVAGDPVYGPKKPAPGLNGQCLHARRIGFVHPRDGRYLELESPLPLYFTEFLRKISGGEY